MRLLILDDWTDTLRSLPSFLRLRPHHVTVSREKVASEDRLVELARAADALILFRERSALPGSVIERLPRLKMVSLRGTTKHVDVEACTRRGVVVSSLPSGSSPPHAAAELTLALILSALRRLPQNMAALREGRWQESAGVQLHDRALGIWSYGRLGREVARLGNAFGARVVVHGSEDALAEARSDGMTVEADRQRFFAEADIVSLHLRLSHGTSGIVNAGLLGAMKPDALFVNTSRAGLVAPGALEAALAEGRPGGAALDVFDGEPLTNGDHPLLAHPNVIATPHLGFVTREELEAQFADVFEQVAAFGRGAPINVVNPASLRK